jgi:hypothetical protein
LLVVMALAATPAIPVMGQSSPNTATSSLQVAVTLAPRLSLHQSARVLTFHVTGPEPAEASLALMAGVRLATGAVVELVADIVQPVDGALTIVDGLEGTIQTSLTPGTPLVVATWMGNGLRTGRLTFRLDGAPGVYDVPITLRLRTDDRRLTVD